MRRIIAAAIGVATLAASGAVAGTASAGPENTCYGEVASEIASTWPWPEDHESFPPPPGALALWVQVFGPLEGVSSVRELQLLFCSQ